MASVRKRTWRTTTGETKTAWQVDFFDNRGDRQRKSFHLKKDADSFRIDVEGQIKAGTHRPDAERVTVKQLCETWLERCEGRHRRDEHMSRKMVAVYRGHIKGKILSPDYGIGGRKLSQLTARAVGEFRDQMREAGVSVPTARKILATLHSALEYAISQDWVATNPAHGVRVIGPRAEGSKKVVPPSKEAMRALLEAASAEDQRTSSQSTEKRDGRRPGLGEEAPLLLALTFAASTGARAGEQWAIRWHDLSFETRELHIARRVDVYRDEGAPKTDAGVRTVPLSAPMIAMLKEWKLRSKFSKPDDLVFPNSEGRHIGHDNFVKRRFLPLLDRAIAANSGVLTTRFNWHALRHFAVSCWIEARLAPKTVQTFAGHASLQITMDRYGHLFPSEDHRKAMDAIAKGLLA
jgi:integrase